MGMPASVGPNTASRRPIDSANPVWSSRAAFHFAHEEDNAEFLDRKNYGDMGFVIKENCLLSFNLSIVLQRNYIVPY